MIWKWRNSLADDTHWTPPHAIKSADTRWRSALDTLSYSYFRDDPKHPGPAIINHLISCRELAPFPKDKSKSDQAQERVLFFDGGSRGNPGPGGAGAVIVGTTTTGAAPQILWYASLSLANPVTTNNIAEYRGLLAGLNAAKERGWTRLHVVGDSSLILRQLHRYRPPRKPPLRQLYTSARCLADELDVVSWRHHYRTHNRMADFAANVAMDTLHSRQIDAADSRSDEPTLCGITARLNNDFTRWLQSRSDQ